jgi:Ca-activated chloride channel family protein
MIHPHWLKRPHRVRTLMMVAVLIPLGSSVWSHSQGTQLVPEVKLTVTITDKSGRYIGGLRKEQVSLWDEKLQQDITVFQEESGVPVSIGFVFDMPRLKQTDLYDVFKAALTSFLAASGPTYEYFMISFDSKPNLVTDLTNDRNQIFSDFVKLPLTATSNKRALSDALHLAIEKSETTNKPKHVILLIADDKDDGSNLKRAELLTAIRKSDVLVYAIRVVLPGGTNMQSSFLNELSSVTGGMAVSPKSTVEFRDAMERLALELQHQYFVAFHPTGDGRLGAWHRLEFRVEPLLVKEKASSKDVKKVALFARTREGHYVGK